MESFLLLILLIGLLPIFVWLLVSKLRGVRQVNANSPIASASSSAPDSGTAPPPGIGLVLFVWISLIGLDLFAILKLVEGSFAGTITKLLQTSGGIQMDFISTALIRLLVSLAAFFIVYALFIAIIPGVLPQNRASRSSAIYSTAISFCLAAAFAIFLGTNDAAFGQVWDKLTDGVLGIVITFITVVITAASVYLGFRQLQRTFWPNISSKP